MKCGRMCTENCAVHGSWNWRSDSDLIYTKTVMEKKSLLEVEREFVDKLPSETINEMTCCLFLICLWSVINYLFYCFWLTWKNVSLWVSLCDDQCWPDCPARWLSCVAKTLNIANFSGTINMINVRLCLMILLIELCPFISLSLTLSKFLQGHSSVKQVEVIFFYVLSD